MQKKKLYFLLPFLIYFLLTAAVDWQRYYYMKIATSDIASASAHFFYDIYTFADYERYIIKIDRMFVILFIIFLIAYKLFSRNQNKRLTK